MYGTPKKIVNGMTRDGPLPNGSSDPASARTPMTARKNATKRIAAISRARSVRRIASVSRRRSRIGAFCSVGGCWIAADYSSD
jgi:hypothetical protein